MRIGLDYLSILDGIALAVGALWVIKKFIDLDRFHELKVLVLTMVLSCFVVYFFVVYGFTFGDPDRYAVHDCQPGPDQFCIAE